MNSKGKIPAPAGNNVLSQPHEVFVHAMIHGATATEAYMEAYPDSSKDAAYSSSSRLMSKPEIRRCIREGKEKMRNERSAAKRQDIIKNIDRIDARLQTLADIINGDWVRRDTSINKDTGVIIERYREDPASAIQAMKLEIKLLETRERLVAELDNIDNPVYEDENGLRAMSEEELDENIRQLLMKIDVTHLPPQSTPAIIEPASSSMPVKKIKSEKT